MKKVVERAAANELLKISHTIGNRELLDSKQWLVVSVVLAELVHAVVLGKERKRPRDQPGPAKTLGSSMTASCSSVPVFGRRNRSTTWAHSVVR